MKMPPLWMRIRIDERDKRIGLWLPLFLLWPLVLVILLLLSPLILIAVLVLWPSGWGKLAWGALRGTGSVFCAMHGLRVDVKKPRQTVYISVV